MLSKPLKGCFDLLKVCGALIHVGFDGNTTCANSKPCPFHNEDGSSKRAIPTESASRKGEDWCDICAGRDIDVSFGKVIPLCLKHFKSYKPTSSPTTGDAEEFDWEKAIDHTFAAWKITSEGAKNDIKATIRIERDILAQKRYESGWESALGRGWTLTKHLANAREGALDEAIAAVETIFKAADRREDRVEVTDIIAALKKLKEPKA